MAMQIQINQDKKELKSHGCYEFPVMVSHENLFSYERGSFFWHWHPEIEFTLILEGDIVYHVENQTYHLSAGDALFCNANMLHTGHQYNKKDCVYISTTFDPRILYGFERSLIQTKYVTPLTLNSQLSSIHLTRDVDWQRSIITQLQNIWQMTCDKNNTHDKTPEYEQTRMPDAPERMDNSETYELDIQMALMSIWIQIYRHTKPDTKDMPSVMRERERLHQMLAYIHDHFDEKLTLDDLADHINICKSECCRFFKKHMNVTIFDYLMHYRIERSITLLLNTKESITDIAAKTGFANSCYFSKIFKQDVGCTPREYRNRAIIETPAS